MRIRFFVLTALLVALATFAGAQHYTVFKKNIDVQPKKGYIYQPESKGKRSYVQMPDNYTSAPVFLSSCHCTPHVIVEGRDTSGSLVWSLTFDRNNGEICEHIHYVDGELQDFDEQTSGTKN
jgi:hypothetical protein